MAHIRNPVEWAAAESREAARHIRTATNAVYGKEDVPAVRTIAVADLKDALKRGFADFMACRSDVIFLCLIYPLAGLFLARYVVQAEMLPLLFPLASGFALIGPAAAVWLYEMSREREQGVNAEWVHAFRVIKSPSFGAIILLSLLLLAMMLVWLLAANTIYALTLGPEPPASLGAFAADIFTTAAGWTMLLVGVSVGFVFAAAITSQMSTPMRSNKTFSSFTRAMLIAR